MDTYDPVRRFGRVPVNLPVTGWTQQFQGTALPGTVRYLSEGGVMVEFPVELLRGSLVRLALPTRQGVLEVEGKVVWIAAQGNLTQHGLAFLEPQGADFMKRVTGETR